MKDDNQRRENETSLEESKEERRKKKEILDDGDERKRKRGCKETNKSELKPQTIVQTRNNKTEAMLGPSEKGLNFVSGGMMEQLFSVTVPFHSRS